MADFPGDQEMTSQCSALAAADLEGPENRSAVAFVDWHVTGRTRLECCHIVHRRIFPHSPIQGQSRLPAVAESSHDA